MSINSIPGGDLPTNFSIQLRPKAEPGAPEAPPQLNSGTHLPVADTKAVNVDLTAADVEAVDLDKALGIALAAADGVLTGQEAKQLGLTTQAIKKLVAAAKDGVITGAELAGLAPAAKGGAPVTPAPTTNAPAANTPAKPGAKDLDALAPDTRAMYEATDYIMGHWNEVSGGDGLLSKDDIAKNLPDGPGKDAYLKQFENLKFMSIDPGAAAWHNLTPDDLVSIGKQLLTSKDGKMPDWAAIAEQNQKNGTPAPTGKTPAPTTPTAPTAKTPTAPTAPTAPTGQTPATPPAKGETYTVKPGDTLGKIAKQYAHDPKKWKDLLLFNPQIKDPNKIFPGQKLTLPPSWSGKADGKGPTAPVTPTAPKADPFAQFPISGQDESKAMRDTAKYIQQNWESVTGGDKMLSKDDIQKNVPDGPGKDAFLKHFENLKFLNIDEGAEAWTNLLPHDLERVVSNLDQNIAVQQPTDWQLLAEGNRTVYEARQAFKAIDKDGDGFLTGTEIPAEMNHPDGPDTKHSFDDYLKQVYLVPLTQELADHDKRLEAWQKAGGK